MQASNTPHRKSSVHIKPAVPISLFRYVYPITIHLENGSQVLLHKYFTDFDELRRKIGVSAPPLPGKEWNLREELRERRRIAFEYFLEWCLIHERENPIFLEFLSIKQLPPLQAIHQVPKVKAQIFADFWKLLNCNSQILVKLLFFGSFWFFTWEAMLHQIPHSEPSLLNHPIKSTFSSSTQFNESFCHETVSYEEEKKSNHRDF